MNFSAVTGSMISRMSNVIPVLSLVFLSLLISINADAQEKSLAEQMPRIPSKTVDEALKTFKLERGFSLELVASEPLVVDPIDAAFDESGRMYVVEMNDYPFLPEQRVQKYKDQRAETWGHIKLLTDVNGDGKMDKSVIFADKLRWPQSVCCSRGGVYVIAPPNLYYMKDTDGDGVADVKEVVCSGFNTSNVQGLSNGLEWGLDNAIYFPSGMAGGELTVAATKDHPEYKITPGRRDLRLDPQTNQITMVAGGQQYGHTMDDFGNRFICSNSSHIVHVVWPLNYLERNPLLSVPDMTRAIAKEGAAAVVFRASSAEPWRLVRTARRAADPEYRKRLPPSELVPIGFFTSATGITVYRGGAYPEEYRGDVFIGDCGGNLVHRKKLTPSGISFVAERADKDVEFLTSTDNWFRPVNFVNAPDGTLYVLDMYRETIEHPVSIPDDIKALVDLESGHDKGRVWRLIPPDYRRIAPPDLSKASPQELAAALKSPHGWIRDTAQRLLVEKQAQAAVADIRNLLKSSGGNSGTPISPQTRVQALWTLKGLRSLQAEDVLAALKDSDEHVRENGLRLVPEFIEKSGELAAELVKLEKDPAVRVRWQLAFTLGDVPEKYSVPGLKSLAAEAIKDPDLRTAWLSSIRSQMGTVASELLASNADTSTPLLVDLARLIGSGKETAHGLRFLTEVMRDKISESNRSSIVLALGEGLRRRGTTIGQLLTETKADNATRESLNRFFERNRAIIKDASSGEAARIQAVRLIGLADAQLAEPALVELLTPQTSPELQQASVRSLAGLGTSTASSALIDAWRGLGPATRREIVDQLVQSADSAKTLLVAIENGSVKPGEIERDKRQLLMTHPQSSVRDKAKMVLAEAPSNRKQVVADYQPSLELTGDVARGRMLFTKTCMQCHRYGTAGHQVGPDFASIQNKSPADLLIAIMDPNREAQPSFQTYTALTKQGRVHTGIISAENGASVTLKRAEAKEDIVLRDTLDDLVSNGVSLMPEGLEKEINPQQLADIIAALKAGP